MRILFVDDESSVLEGIENRLRRYRRRWDMKFSTNGPQALAMMEEQPFDAIVSDMRMPEMDGAELLTRVRSSFDGTLRIILTGQTSKEQVFKSLSVAHRVLNKPCNALVLEAAIADAQSLENLISNMEVRKLIDKVEALPALPKIHIQLTKLIMDGNADIDSIAKIVQQEPVISGRVLQLVNSSFMGLSREVTCIRDAIAYLGLDCIRGLVLNQELFGSLESKRLSPSFSLQQYQYTSAYCARIAKTLAESHEHCNLIYSAALLHGIGRLVLSYAAPDDYERTLKRCEEYQVALAEAEYQEFGFTHADVGAYLLSLWDLPFDLIDVVANHCLPSRSDESSLGPIGIVHLASILSSSQRQMVPNCEFDMRYLEHVGASGDIPQWLALAEELQ